MELIICGILIFIMIGGGFWQRNNEIKIWNKGICYATGKPWMIFDMDSQGGRGYNSDREYCWISYRIDK